MAGVGIKVVMTFDDIELSEMARRIRWYGRTSNVDAEGNWVIIVSSVELGLPAGQMILIYENRGTYFFNGDRPLNEFRLATAGFSYRYAKDIASMVNTLVMKMAKLDGKEAAKPALLGMVPNNKEVTQ